MSSKEIGIEEARKTLGDLVTAAQQGTDIILTRNRRPVARITRYQEDTMTAQIIIDRLNAWEGQHPYETRQERGLDIWQDVILHLDQYDEESTNRIDQDASDRFALADGTVIRYDGQTQRWYEVARPLEPDTMLDKKGADYVSAWALNIARRLGTADYMVLASVAAVTGSGNLYDPNSPETIARSHAVIGAMTPGTAKEVIAHVRSEMQRLNPAGRAGCRYCGLPVNRDGDCEECV